MTAPAVHCDDCHRPVVVGPLLRDGDGSKYGPRCGRARGLGRGRTVRVGQPARTGRGAEPAIDGLEELMETNEESEEPMTYIQEAIEAVNAELPGLDPELARLYALLALTTGETTTWEDVHNAWSIWQDRTRPDHRSIIPFDELAEATQELDAPYAEGIHQAARKLEVNRG